VSQPVFPIRDILPAERHPFATQTILLLNVLAFVLTLADPEGTIAAFGAYAFEFTGFAPHREGLPAGIPMPDEAVPFWVRAISHMWLHSGLLHLFGNMWFLWIFGDNVEDRLGPVRFVALYLLGGFAALTAQVAMAPDAAVPMIGASGAVAAVLGAYLLYYPEARVVVMFPLGFLPIFFLWSAKVVLGLWVGFQVFAGLATFADPEASARGGVAWWAHVGGFAIGYLLAGPFAATAEAPPRRRHPDLLHDLDPTTGEPFGSWDRYRDRHYPRRRR
jgi:membrane associated rhomboid family serine protease